MGDAWIFTATNGAPIIYTGVLNDVYFAKWVVLKHNSSWCEHRGKARHQNVGDARVCALKRWIEWEYANHEN